jgi:hypothetical protein
MVRGESDDALADTRVPEEAAELVIDVADLASVFRSLLADIERWLVTALGARLLEEGLIEVRGLVWRVRVIEV